MKSRSTRANQEDFTPTTPRERIRVRSRIDSQATSGSAPTPRGIRYKDGNWKTYFPMHAWPLLDLLLRERQEGRFWIGTWGVNHFNVKTGEFKTREGTHQRYGYTGSTSMRRAVSGSHRRRRVDVRRQSVEVVDDKDASAPNVNQLPASSNTGLGTRSRHDLSTMERGDPTYNPNYSFAMHIGPDGDAWVGTWGGGVARFNGKSWRNYSTADGLVGNIVYSIARDDKGAFWFGTDRGVSRFDGKNWKSFTVQDGLLDSHVYTIASAPSGDIWVGTRRGVAIISKK